MDEWVENPRTCKTIEWNILTLSDIKIWTEALLAQNCKGLGKLKIAPES